MNICVIHSFWSDLRITRNPKIHSLKSEHIHSFLFREYKNEKVTDWHMCYGCMCGIFIQCTLDTFQVIWGPVSQIHPSDNKPCIVDDTLTP